MVESRNYDIIVVGAGVAGGVFACSQKNTARKILVIERDLSEQDRIVGELLQPGGIVALRKLKLAHLLNGYDAQQVYGYTLVNNQQHFFIPYPIIDNQSYGLGLKNGKFLQAIQNELRASEHVDLVEGNVVGLIENGEKINGVKYVDKVTQTTIEVQAPLVVISDGPMSLLRDKVSVSNKKVSSYFIGMELEHPEPLFPASGHVILNGKSPCLIYPIKTNVWRILVDYPAEKPPVMGEKMSRFMLDEVLPILPESFHPSFKRAVAKADFKVMPNHYMQARAFRQDGVVLLGDSLNMRHPLTGGGMTACFWDIFTLKEALEKVELSDSSALKNALKNYYNNRTNRVGTINILADSLYLVFKDADLKDLVYNYLKKGGQNAIVPLSLIAGLNRNKKTLVRHFAKVTLQNPSDFVFRPRKQFRTMRKAFNIMYPILKEENKRAIKA